MNEELRQLRILAQALVAERRAYALWSSTMSSQIAEGAKPTPESVQVLRSLLGEVTQHEAKANAALAQLALIAPGHAAPDVTSDREWHQLRILARALEAERQAEAEFSNSMRTEQSVGKNATPESIREMRRLGTIYHQHETETDAALAKLAEIAPEVISPTVLTEIEELNGATRACFQHDTLRKSSVVTRRVP